jgi:hypothetical protein
MPHHKAKHAEKFGQGPRKWQLFEFPSLLQTDEFEQQFRRD